MYMYKKYILPFHLPNTARNNKFVSENRLLLGMT